MAIISLWNEDSDYQWWLDRKATEEALRGTVAYNSSFIA